MRQGISAYFIQALLEINTSGPRDVKPEVDGMGAGDRGGMAALNRTLPCSPTRLITTTSFPQRLAG